jgi:type IX secretion system PorP/SprF family membrane protein
MVLKRNVLLSLLLLLTIDLFAQQDPQYSQYMFNTLAVNPAYAGSRDVLSMTALGRKQWVGLAGAPTSATFSADCPVRKEKIGLGLMFSTDKIGIQKTTAASFFYAYRIRARIGTLALGLSGGVMQYNADLTSVALSSNNTQMDPAFQNNVNKILPNFGAGVYFSNDKLYLGVSAPHLVNNTVAAYRVANSISYGTQSRHYFIMGGYVFNLSSSLKYKPSFLIKMVEGSPVQADLNSNLWFHDRFAIGFSYRTSDAVVVMGEVQINHQLRFGYAFDYSLNKLSNYNSGTHEIMLRYEFGFGGKVITSPRYF